MKREKSKTMAQFLIWVNVEKKNGERRENCVQEVLNYVQIVIFSKILTHECNRAELPVKTQLYSGIPTTHKYAAEKDPN